MQYSTTAPDRVLIVGAGIAGPALAIALRRVGIYSVVYESNPSPRESAGAFLNLAPNGLRVLKALGLGERSMGLGFMNDRLVFHSETGRVLADVQVGALTALRGVVSRALRQVAETARVPFEFGRRLQAVEQQDGGVVAHFADGSTAAGRLLVGADGIHSGTRHSLFPAAPKPTYTGLINLGGIVLTDLKPTGSAMHMIFGRKGFFGYAVRPSGETYWFSNYAQPEEPAPGSLDMVEGSEYRRRLLQLHRDDPREVTRILSAVTGTIGAYADYEIAAMPRWYRDNVCLIGDAAHALGPHIGQGSSLALEDAFVLAKCLRDIPDTSNAFRTFEALRRDRVERAAQYSRKISEQKMPGGWFGRVFRDLFMPSFLRKGARASQWLYDYHVDWNERVTPPDDGSLDTYEGQQPTEE